MKVIVTGATGFVGGAVAEQCIANPQVTSVLILSRKEIRNELSDHSKVKVILHQDFASYPATLLDQLKGAVGCIWSVGGKVEDFPDVETARRVGIDYTLAAARAFATSLATELEPNNKFPFVFCSGNGAEWDQNRKLWLFPETRKLKGAVEEGLFKIAEEHSSVFSAFTLRPGGVLPDQQRLVYSVASSLTSAVLVSDLARALVKVCIEQPAKTIFENKEVVSLGTVVS